MKRLKKSKKSSKRKISDKARQRVILATVALCLLVPLSLLIANRFTVQEPPPYELEKYDGGIDFTAPEIKAHTAADGVAVVKAVQPAKPAETAAPVFIPASTSASVSASPAMITDNPASIWQGEQSPTHGGFTLPVPMDGDSIGVLTIPDIKLSVRVYEAENEMEAMEIGVAHFKSTSSWEGNIGLSAHNINLDGTPGYFLSLHKLKEGSVIRYETALGTREYVVESMKEISEMDWSMLTRTQDNRLTLITCITGKPSMRLAVQATEK